LTAERGSGSVPDPLLLFCEVLPSISRKFVMAKADPKGAGAWAWTLQSVPAA
jgi:hypothetical protein